MPHLNTAISGAAGTPPVARGGASGPRRSTGAGRARSSNDGFSTVLDDLSQPPRAQASSERAAASPSARPARASAPRAAEVPPLDRRSAKSVGKPAPVPATVPPSPPVVEAQPEPLVVTEPHTRVDAASDAGAVAEASEVSVPVADAVVPAATTAFSDTGDSLETSRVADLYPIATVPQPESEPPTDALSGPPEAAARDGERAGLPVDGDRGFGAATLGATNHSGWVTQSDAPRGAATPDAAAPVAHHLLTSPRGGDPAAATVPSATPATFGAAVPSDVEVPPNPDVSPGDGPVGTGSEPLRAQMRTALDEVIESVVDAQAMPAPNPDLPGGETDASESGRGDEGAQTGGDRLPDGTIPQASTFMVPADIDGLSSEPQGAASSHAPERALESQLVQAMRVQWRGGLGEATITLRPEHLGQVRIMLRLEGGALQAHLQVEDPKVRAWVESHSEVLRSGLAQQGLDLARLVVSDQPSEGGRRETSSEERGRRGQRPQGPWATTDADDAPRFEVRA